MAEPTPRRPGADSRALAETLPAAAFAPGEARRWLERRDEALRRQAAPVDDAPALARPGLRARLAERGVAWSGGDGPRYDVRRALGAGGTGRVYAIADRVLGRDIAVKVLDREPPAPEDEIAAFVDEARITASLEHPNVLPVYDLDVDERGRPWFSMRTARGRSLGDALRAAQDGAPAAPIDSVNGIVNVFIQVCNALSFAHHRGVVHQDVKPDNILLGGFGEVLLLDWGSALVAGGRQKIYGTPLYMSPEQARRSHADARSDVYCVAACLFHALVGRIPTWSDVEDEFWRRKRDGEIDAPTAAERRRVPEPLLAIAAKALAAAPDARYATIDALAADLRGFQAGLAIVAWRGSPLQRLAGWLRRRARAVAWSLAMATTVCACAAVLYGERLKELATWGAPILVEDFADDGWARRWRTLDGGFARGPGGIVSTAGFSNVALYDRRLHGPVAIEYDGVIAPGSAGGDISAVWCPGRDDAAPTAAPWYQIEVGGRDNRIAGITSSVGQGNLVVVPLSLETGRRYRVRVEVDGVALRLYLDGRLLCEHHATVPFTSGHLGLFGYGAGKSFGRVAIYARGIPEKVGALAVGDSYVDNDLYELAAREYRAVRESHPDRPIADEALYKEGECLVHLARDGEAQALWDGLRAPHWRAMARCHRLERAVAADDHAAAVAGIRELRREAAGDHELALRLRGVWMLGAQRAIDIAQPAALDGYAALFDDAFAADPALEYLASRVYLRLGRYERAVQRFPRDAELCGWALAALGRDDETLARFRGPFTTGDALLHLGRYEEALAEPGARVLAALALDRVDQARAFAAAGAPGGDWVDLYDRPLDEVAADAAATPRVRVAALTLLGRFDEAVAIDGGGQYGAWRAQIAAGRPQDAVAANRGARYVRSAAAAWSIVAARIAGDEAAERRWRSAFDEEAIAIGDGTVWFERWLLLPMLRELGGEAGALERSARAALADDPPSLHAGRLRAAALRVLGRIDAPAFLAQPTRREAPALLLLCDALRAESAGDPTGALTCYRSWRALPLARRGVAGIDRDDALWRFVDWRIARLQERVAR